MLMGFLIKMGPPHFLRSTKCHVGFAFHESYPLKLMLPATHRLQGGSKELLNHLSYGRVCFLYCCQEKRYFLFFLFLVSFFSCFCGDAPAKFYRVNSDGLVRVIKILVLVSFKTMFVGKIGLYLDS
jgi:hypothetical protein